MMETNDEKLKRIYNICVLISQDPTVNGTMSKIAAICDIVSVNFPLYEGHDVPPSNEDDFGGSVNIVIPGSDE